MERSKVATAYAEIHADTAPLEKELGQVPAQIRSLLNTRNVTNVKQLIGGDVSGFIGEMIARKYEAQAEALTAAAKESEKTAKELEAQAKEFQKTADALEKELAADDKAKAAGKGGLSAGDRAAKEEQYQISRGEAARLASGARVAKAEGEQMAAAGARAGKLAAGAAAAAVAVVAVAVVGIKKTLEFVSAAADAAAKRQTDRFRQAATAAGTGNAAGWDQPKLKHMADELRKASALSTAEIMKAQNELLKFGNVKGREYQAALKAAADIAAATGGEIESIAGALGAVLQEPEKAAEGALEQFGVFLTQAEKGMVKNAVAARDWAKAQNLVLAGLKGYSGAAAENANTGAAAWDRLFNAAEALGDKIGDHLIPIVGHFVGMAADLIDWVSASDTLNDSLQFVADTWDALNDAVMGFVARNQKDFEEWGALVYEIFRDVKDFILQGFRIIKDAVVAVWKFVAGEASSTWDGIKYVIKTALEYASLLTADFGLTALLTWKQIQLGASALWDSVVNGARLIVSAFKGAFAAIVAGASEAFDQIVKALSGEGGSMDAVGAAMAKGFRDAFADGMKGAGESPLTRQLREERDALLGQMDDMRKATRAQRAAEDAERAKKAKEARDAMETPNKPGRGYTTNKPFQYEFTGFKELYSKIQTSLYPGEQIQLARAGVKFAEEAVNKQGQAVEKLGKIEEKLGQPGRMGP
jgi:phage-related protein